MGEKARSESAKLALSLIDKQANGGPAFLVGDLNSPASEGAYKTLAASLQDAAHGAPEDDRYGHHKTYTGFDNSEPKTIIDYIFGTSDVSFVSYGVLHSHFDGITFSDHRPVVADVIHKSAS
jgi:endonuclease/exonuclease/phosphatase family metal-dependent hydrolase